MNQPTKPDRLIDAPLPAWIDAMKGSDPTMDDVIAHIEQLRTEALAALAARQPVAGSVDTPEFAQQMRIFLMDNVRIGPAKAINMATAIIAFVKAASPIAPAAPSGEAVYQIESALKDGLYWRDTNETVYSEHFPEHRRVLYTRPAPSDVDAPIVLPPKPEPDITYEDGKDEWGYTAHSCAHSDDALITYATAAVQKDRADWKEMK